MKLNTTALARSATTTIWFVTISAIASELYAPLKNFFVSVARHHWTGKSVIAVGIFVVMYFVLFKMKESDTPEKSIRNLIINTIICGLLIFGYFLWHFLSA